MNKKKIYIIGTTDFSFMVGHFIELENKYEIIGYVVSEECYENSILFCTEKNVELFCLEKLLSECCQKSLYFLNTIGYTKMNTIREKISKQCRDSGAIMINYISEKSLNYGAVIGTNNIVLPGAYVGTNVTIQNDNVVYAGALLTHDIKIGNYNFIAANSTIGGNVVINNNCFIGMGATIKNSVRIESYTLVGAGCYLSNDTIINSVIVPARSIELGKKSCEIVIGG